MKLEIAHSSDGLSTTYWLSTDSGEFFASSTTATARIKDEVVNDSDLTVSVWTLVKIQFASFLYSVHPSLVMPGETKIRAIAAMNSFLDDIEAGRDNIFSFEKERSTVYSTHNLEKEEKRYRLNLKQERLERLSTKLPGDNFMLPDPPPDFVRNCCFTMRNLNNNLDMMTYVFGYSLHGFIVHLNDVHKMPREEIADWLDELHDSGVVDLEFKVEV